MPRPLLPGPLTLPENLQSAWAVCSGSPHKHAPQARPLHTVSAWWLHAEAPGLRRYQVEGSSVNQSTNASAVVCPSGYTRVGAPAAACPGPRA